MYSNRKPYYQLKKSITEFFSGYSRFIKNSLTKESAFEKPYFDMEYPQMHLNLPYPKFKPSKEKIIIHPRPGGFGELPINLGTANIFYGDPICSWAGVFTDNCITGSVIITVRAQHFWSAMFTFNSIVETTINNLGIVELPPSATEQDYKLTFPPTANGTVTVCATASAISLVSETYTTIAGFPVTLNFGYGSGISVLTRTGDYKNDYSDKVGKRVSAEYGSVYANCDCVELTSSCASQCDTATIDYTTTQMATDENQTLSVTAPQEGCEYTWTLTTDSGASECDNLSSYTGSSTLYTAPSTNANCSCNPTITLSVNGVITDSITVAVNEAPAWFSGYEYYDVEIVPTTFDNCTRVTGTCQGCYITRVKRAHYRSVYCDGSVTMSDTYVCGDPTYLEAWSCVSCTPTLPTDPCSCGDNCPYPEDPVILANCYAVRGVPDQRTVEMLAAGCCPQQLI